MTATADVNGNYRACPTCAAPLTVPMPPTWDLELVKEGERDGPVASYITPHRDDCTALHADPHPGIAVRVKGHYVRHINIDIPPVPSGTQAWQDGPDVDLATDLRAAADAMTRDADRPYEPEPLAVTPRALDFLRDLHTRERDARQNRDNIYDGPPDPGYLFYAPLNEGLPTPTGGSPWINLGTTDGFTAVGDIREGQMVQRAGDGFVKPVVPYSIDGGVVETHGAIGGVGESWACTGCGYHNNGGVCTHCGQVAG